MKRVNLVWPVVFFSLCSITAGNLLAGESTALARITQDVTYLASDELQGRGPGTEGLDKAAQYIRDEFQRLGLKSGVPDGSYFQPFEITLGESPVPAETHLVLHAPDGTEWSLDLGEQFVPFFTGEDVTVSAPVVFAGYGITAPDLQYDDYRNVDVEGKIVLVIRREPQQDLADSRFDGRNTTAHSYIVNKLKQATDHKAAGVLLVNDPFTARKEKADAFLPSNPGVRNAKIPFAMLKMEIADKIFSQTPIRAGDNTLRSLEEIESYIDQRMEPVSMELPGWTARLAFRFRRETVSVVNVIGVLEPADPNVQDTIVIGAHYDHLGNGGFGSRRPNSREIHNGADDNASGTAALLELARRFSARPERLSRRLVFAAFSAEERGLLGSNYYVSHPLFPIENTVAMVNFDMIGTLRNNQLEVHGVGSGKGFEPLVDEAAKSTDLSIKKIPGVMAASDHYSFYRNKIPVVFFFTGLTDTYHTPDDDVERLNMEGMVRIIDYAERFLELLAQHPERIAYVEAPSQPRRRGGMASLGIVPDYAAEVSGVRVSSVRPDTPAARAGIQTGDVIVKLGDMAIPDLEALAEALRQHRPGETVTVVVIREENEVQLQVQLAAPGRGS
ncbi:MAG: hypothetical protein KatS3mg110_3835 [Pirellulaceae bacterium]|nr:MAG: hypothetical protein KatS3mg110_3835 [Pirellulaceae bacterium]